MTGRNLSWFFRQWVEEAGQPHLAIEKINIKKVGEEFAVYLELRQEGRPKKLALPVRFRGPDGDRSFLIDLDQGKKHYSFRLDFSPQEVIIDENYHVFRTLQPMEIPPNLKLEKGGKLTVQTPFETPKGIRRQLADRHFRSAVN